MADTVKVILLKGDKRNPESAEHVIKFPGGSIAVTRTGNNEYWAHIAVNHEQVIDGTVQLAKFGNVIDSRIDRDRVGDNMDIIEELDNMELINHIAVRIKTIPAIDGELYEQ